MVWTSWIYSLLCLVLFLFDRTTAQVQVALHGEYPVALEPFQLVYHATHGSPSAIPDEADLVLATRLHLMDALHSPHLLRIVLYHTVRSEHQFAYGGLVYFDTPTEMNVLQAEYAAFGGEWGTKYVALLQDALGWKTLESVQVVSARGLPVEWVDGVMVEQQQSTTDNDMNEDMGRMFYGAAILVPCGVLFVATLVGFVRWTRTSLQWRRRRVDPRAWMVVEDELALTHNKKSEEAADELEDYRRRPPQNQRILVEL